ncbi:hypothetical protein A2875_04930 [Candidatus Gottesmanbacteria bacterium RIFCSPHIGHO2_01_FULL_46_14]|uniref:Uncharacterized protein n=3 Tax=Microgenomates group TaxID=1794810 RepID=A0A1F5ZRE8_9BACT|nr:MAG: hypothetical protein UU34_C0006G0036 [Candidatus Curtissbacteria bacterium GW2011_GWA1_41_11]OGG14672.1 MAG: hypothetical protein A2875_04930 [Candidatus Gottesmanbacteria bacterium RIFCSPHIGHO2_01_FULL_46_14]OGG29929.1 MAG: hypothetical protein A2971_04220 [Candidatus Gottesmanbacteria bacterium RIFCSPLOWO2_01_FULL_46_21]
MLRNPIIGALTAILLLVAINLVWIDIIIFSQGKSEPIVSYRDPQPTSTPTPIVSGPTPYVVFTPAPTLPTFIQGPISQAKEYYIPLGSGTTKSNEYVALDGAQVYIDTALYDSIKRVTFEVFLRNPTGNGRTYAKLFNATDKHDVWFSEVYFEGGGLVRKEATITLEPGNKLYQVYLKSSLAYDVYVDNARIHIITQ